MFLAHGPVSFLANELIQKKSISKLTQNEKIYIGIAAIFFGICPDLDIFVLQGLGLPTFIHHELISHTILFYTCLWLIFKLIFVLFYKLFSKQTTKVLNKEFLNILLNTFLIATITHLLADFLVTNMMILYPFSTEMSSIFANTFQPNLFAGYFFSISFGIEAVLCAIFLGYIINRIFKRNSFFKVFNIVLITISILFLGSNIFAYINTYNRSIVLNKEGEMIQDWDKDAIIDETDSDVDNDGVDNLMDIDIKELVLQVGDTISTSKWTEYDNSEIVAHYKKTYGGFNSFRLLSQAYYNMHSPITPVLWDQATKDGTVSKYTDNLAGLDSLHSYFSKKNLLTRLTYEETVFATGTLFFISTQEAEVLNVGIVLNNNEVGIVLPYDKKLQTHSFSDVTNYYGANVIVEFTE